MRVRGGKRTVDLDIVQGKFQGRSKRVVNFHTSGLIGMQKLESEPGTE